MDTKPLMAILIGIQGSGKSTFCREYLGDAYVRVNLDTLRTRSKENQLIQACLSEHRSLVIDNTNPSKTDRERYITPGKQNGYKIVGYFLQSKLQVCISRNNLRSGSARIPAKAIAATANRLEMPDYSEGFDELYFVAYNGSSITVSEWRDEE